MNRHVTPRQSQKAARGVGVATSLDGTHALRGRLRALWPIALLAVLFAGVAAIGATHVTLRLRALETRRAISVAEDERTRLEVEARELTVEVNAQKSPARVLPAAREKLRLLPAAPTQAGVAP